MPESDLKRQLADRFREVNGDHPMTDADDAYVSRQFVEYSWLAVVITLLGVNLAYADLRSRY